MSSRLERPIVVFDAKCPVCSNLAEQIQLLARKPVSVRALSDPAVAELLAMHYPDGYEHNFYLIASKRCHKGWRVGPKLLRFLGLRRTLSVFFQYVSFSLTRASQRTNEASGSSQDAPPSGETTEPDNARSIDPSTEAAPARDGRGLQSLSRRRILQFGAVTPLAYLGAKLSEPEAQSQRLVSSGLNVHFAQVDLSANGQAPVGVSRCTDCVRTSPQPLQVEERDRLALESHRSSLLLDESLPLKTEGTSFSDGPGAANLKVYRQQFTSVILASDRREELARVPFDVHQVHLDHPRYDLMFSFAKYGEAGSGRTPQSVSGLMHHDVLVHAVDYLSIVPDSSGDPLMSASAILGGCSSGLNGLQQRHLSDGREDLAAVYQEMAGGIPVLDDALRSVTDGSLAAENTVITVTPLTALMRWVQLDGDQRLVSFRDGPMTLQQLEYEKHCGCDCTCGCCSSCGFGCGCGLCSTPCPFCFCCVSCCVGCGCSCACGCCL